MTSLQTVAAGRTDLVGPRPQPDLPGSHAEVFVEEGADFAEGFFGFGSLIVELVLSVRFAFEDLQLRIDACFAEFAVHANGVAQEQSRGCRW